MTITPRQVIAQLIRGHCGVPGNEAARYAALRTVVGTNWIAVVRFIIFWSCDRLSWLYRQLPTARWYSVIIIDTSSVMKYFSYNLAPQHVRTAAVYINKASYKVSSSKTRPSPTAQLRSGYHHKFAAVTVHLPEVSFVRRVICPKRIGIGLRLGLGLWLGLGLGLGLGLVLDLGLGLGLASNFGICTTTFRTNDPSDKWPVTIRCISHHRPTSRSLPRIKLSITHFRACPGTANQQQHILETFDRSFAFFYPIRSIVVTNPWWHNKKP